METVAIQKGRAVIALAVARKRLLLMMRISLRSQYTQPVCGFARHGNHSWGLQNCEYSLCNLTLSHKLLTLQWKL